MQTQKKSSKPYQKGSIINNKPTFQFAFDKDNYIWMIIGVVLLIIGYILLIGGGSKDSNTFSYSLFNARRLVFSPIFILGGLVVEVYAIMKKSKKDKQEK
jgi:hypothetical protein